MYRASQLRSMVPVHKHNKPCSVSKLAPQVGLIPLQVKLRAWAYTEPLLAYKQLALGVMVTHLQWHGFQCINILSPLTYRQLGPAYGVVVLINLWTYSTQASVSVSFELAIGR